MTENRKLRVFVCHSSQDKPIVRELLRARDSTPSHKGMINAGLISGWLSQHDA